MTKYRSYNDGDTVWLQYKSKWIWFSVWKRIRTFTLECEVIGSSLGMGLDKLYICNRNTDIHEFVKKYPDMEAYAAEWNRIVSEKVKAIEDRRKRSNEIYKGSRGRVTYL